MRFLGALAVGLCACTGSSRLDDGVAVATSRDVHGVPRMLVARGQFADTPREHVATLAPQFGVLPMALPQLRELGDIRLSHARVARIAQSIDGLPIWGGELRVLVRDTGELAALSGTLVGTTAARTPKRFVDDETAAIGKAMQRAGNSVVERALARQVWYRTGDALVTAWVVDAYTAQPGSTVSDANRTIIAGDDGRILEHGSLSADAAFDYRVFAETTGEKHPLDGPTVDFTPHPTGMPDGVFPAYVPPSLVRVDGLDSLGDPWLEADATATTGNNVDAYADFNAPSGLSSGDFRATTTGAATFDRVYDTAQAPMVSTNQQMAAITSLFYVINWLHDFWYDNGFTETAGNAQKLNYGRGGVENDPILAEAQDNALGGSRNNANMATPDDGMSPRMQVFLWNGKDTRSLALSPSGRTPPVGGAAFGPKDFTVSAPLVLGVDGTGVNANDGCEPYTNDVTGKVVLVDRGNCTFKTKTLNAQNGGAVGVLIANNVAGGGANTLGEDSTIMTEITVPSMSVAQVEGAALKTDLAAGAVTAAMHRDVGIELDGGLDSTLIAHEYGHYLHHRLSLCGNAICRAMSEGWGDFTALLLLARPGDNLDGAFPFSIYTTQSFTSDPGYYGIRRAPYSVDMAINSLSFRHMANGEPLPADNFIPSNTNAEVHNAGEVWAAALWEVYVALQKAGTDFVATRAKMARYVVAGLAMTPAEASPMEVRDAILATAAAESPADHDLMLAAFARRGFGSCAVAPPRDSVDFVGLVESKIVAGKAELVSTSLEDDCDHDGVFDSGEKVHVLAKLANKGHAPLTGVQVVASTPDLVGLTIDSPAIDIAVLDAGATADLDIELSLAAGSTEPLHGTVVLAIRAEGGCEQTLEIPIVTRENVDDVPNASATDTFDTAGSTWTALSTAWKHVRKTPLDGLWHGDDVAVLSDARLVTPYLAASATEPVRITFDQVYSFEHSSGTAFDGGVIEYAVGNDDVWEDISTLASPSYSGTLGTDTGNPLAGRAAYVGRNAQYPRSETVTLDLGTALAGKAFRLRFRIGTDSGTSAEGWTIDNVAFTGIVGTPFGSQVGDDGHCGGAGSGSGDGTLTSGGGGCCDAGTPRTGGLLSLGVLALVLRRRRRPAR